MFDVAEFPARKNGVASALPSGPLGPGFAKIAAGAIQKLRLGFPNQRSRCWIRRRGGPCGRPRWIRNQLSVLFVGAAISRPQAFPYKGKVPPKGADEGAFLACTPPGGRPKGLPYLIPEEVLANRRGGRLPLSRGDVERSETKGIGICPSRGPASVRPLRGEWDHPCIRVGAGVLTRPPDFRQGSRKAVGVALAVARDGYGIGFRFSL